MPEETTKTTTVTEPTPDPATVRTVRTVTTPAVSWQQDLYSRATSRKFLAYLASMLTIGGTYFSHEITGSMAIASVLITTAMYLGSEAVVDSARARIGGRE